MFIDKNLRRGFGVTLCSLTLCVAFGCDNGNKTDDAGGNVDSGHVDALADTSSREDTTPDTGVDVEIRQDTGADVGLDSAEHVDSATGDDGDTDAGDDTGASMDSGPDAVPGEDGGDGCVATAETCNGLDDDCDGDIDETFDGLGDACHAGTGECQVEGVVECAPSGDSTVCTVGSNVSSDGLCECAEGDPWVCGCVDGYVGDGLACSPWPFRVIAAGGDHSCGVRENNTLWCWGSNSDGELGDGTKVDRATPTQVGVDEDWETVGVGNSHSCAVRDDGCPPRQRAAVRCMRPCRLR